MHSKTIATIATKLEQKRKRQNNEENMRILFEDHKGFIGYGRRTALYVWLIPF
jgi:hypothetical protein